MEIESTKIEQLRELLNRPAQKIVTLAHTNPDGDAIGSSLAWAEALEAMGHSVTCVAPNSYPYFLSSMPGIARMHSHRTDDKGVVDRAITEADVIFFIDFNAVSRLEDLGALIQSNEKAVKVLIDHHLSPEPNFDISFSYPECSSTCFLVYSLIEKLWGQESISATMAENIYVGMMTDTGNFSFSNLTPALFRAVANLMETGISIPYINNYVYNSYSEDRARLFGYIVNCKMKMIQSGSVAYMSLTEAEMRRYNFQQGDSEGFVNYPLTVKKMKMSAIFVAHRNFVRISLRSRGDVDVNIFARRYFEGGGHKNAAGGKSFLSIEQTIERFIAAVDEYQKEGCI